MIKFDFTWLVIVSIDSIDSMTVLNMSGNVIPLLMGQQFSTLGLINLQRISMAKCGLVQIDGHAFGGLNNLVELDLSQNLLKQVRRVSQRIFQEAFFKEGGLFSKSCYWCSRSCLVGLFFSGVLASSNSSFNLTLLTLLCLVGFQKITLFFSRPQCH